MDEINTTNIFTPKLLAKGNLKGSEPSSNASIISKEHNNHYKSLEWSTDGTCIITNSADNSIRTYIVPPDLLAEREAPHRLQPYSKIPSSASVNVVAGYPLFNLQDVSTCMVVSVVSEHPIRLTSVLTGDLVASYPLVNPSTEAHVKPHSLLFTNDANRLLAGSEHLISIFDVAVPGQGPIVSLHTGPRRLKGSWSNPAASLRGFVSALAIDNQHNILAAGTLSRQIGLYDSAGSGECVGVFSVEGTDADHAIGGRGITQALWSPCGCYLYIAERKSAGVMTYDIRKTGQLLGWLEGREANTNQRMGIELSDPGDGHGHQIWAGGLDGYVRCWNEPHANTGAMQSSTQFRLQDDAVNGTAIHSSGSVLAAVSGQRHFSGVHDNGAVHSMGESSLTLWAL